MLFVLALCVLGQPDGVAKEPEKVPAKAPVKEAEKPEAPSSSEAKVAVPFPHPMISEVLFAVPTGNAGDANKDGKRDVCGDEFVELVNPHDRAIQLFGYTLTDSQDAGKGQVRFTFPAVELAPGAVAVVFNGMGSTWSGPVGDAKTSPPPPGKNELFAGAMVFTMKNTKSQIALGNTGDQVLLSAPDKTAVHRVYWSETGPEPEDGPTKEAAPGVPPSLTKAGKARPLVVDFVPLMSKCSVQRDGVLGSGRFVSHLEAEGAAFSPGVYVVARGAEKPAESKPSKQESDPEKSKGSGTP